MRVEYRGRPCLYTMLDIALIGGAIEDRTRRRYV